MIQTFTTTKTPTARCPRRRLASQARPPLVVVIVVVMVIVIGTVKVVDRIIAIGKIESVGNLVLTRWRSLLLFMITVEPRVE